MKKVTVVFEPVDLNLGDGQLERSTTQEIRKMALARGRLEIQNILVYERRIGEKVWTEAFGLGTVIRWEGPDEGPEGFEVEMEDGEVRYLAADEVFDSPPRE